MAEGMHLSLEEKLKILSAAAKYDVACTSSGSSRRGKKGSLGNAVSGGICHSFSSDGRCISLLKILMSNDCIFDCKYCINRAANLQRRTTFTPEELCGLTVEFYRRNYIEGLFLSSAVVRTPAYTMERMYETLYKLRNQYHFNGYIHVKAIPGAPDELVCKAGYLADRMSVNLELPTVEGLQKLAPNKKPEALIRPMRQIHQGIAAQRLAQGKSARLPRARGNHYLSHTIFQERNHFDGRLAETARSPERLLSEPAARPGSVPDRALGAEEKRALGSAGSGRELTQPARTEQAAAQKPESVLSAADMRPPRPVKMRDTPFVPAGQSTQIIIGASGESDFHLLTLTQRLYQQYDLKRVFYSAYIPLNDDPALPSLGTAPPLLREHRLYQADWLLRYYGFRADELLSEEKPDFNPLLDPKCDWALKHLEYFPVEINRASYEQLLRVPGIGNKSAARIMCARRQGSLDFEHIKKMGVVLKRAVYFITCKGRMQYPIPIDEGFIGRRLIGDGSKEAWEISHPVAYRQMSLFDDFHLT